MDLFWDTYNWGLFGSAPKPADAADAAAAASVHKVKHALYIPLLLQQEDESHVSEAATLPPPPGTDAPVTKSSHSTKWHLSDTMLYPSKALPPLPGAPGEYVRVCCISDTHEKHWAIRIPPCHVLIHAGDVLLCNRRFSLKKSAAKLADFNQWLGSLTHVQHKVFIGGNHDACFDSFGKEKLQSLVPNGKYIENECYTVPGTQVKIWGTPLSFGHSGNAAFQVRNGKKSGENDDGSQFWPRHAAATGIPVPADQQGYSLPAGALAPECVDIFVSHEPCVSPNLLPVWDGQAAPVIHLGGHQHEAYGIYTLPSAATKSKKSRRGATSAPMLDVPRRVGHHGRVPTVKPPAVPGGQAEGQPPPAPVEPSVITRSIGIVATMLGSDYETHAHRGPVVFDIPRTGCAS